MKITVQVEIDTDSAGYQQPRTPQVYTEAELKAAERARYDLLSDMIAGCQGSIPTVSLPS